MDMETEIQMLAQSMTGADQGEQDYLAALCAAQWERISQDAPGRNRERAQLPDLRGGKPGCGGLFQYQRRSGYCFVERRRCERTQSGWSILRRGSQGTACAAERLLAPLCSDGGFAFLGVRDDGILC